MKLGRVISSEIGLNRDGDTRVLLLKVEITEPDDPQTVEYLQAAGEDYRPPEDSNVIVTDLGEAYKIAIAADDGIEPEAAAGEREIYAHVGGVKKGRLKCNLDGTVQAGVTGLDFVSQANKIDQIISDIHGVINGWTPLANDGGAALKAAWLSQFGTPPSSASTASANLKSED
jgi:hypothetical protein